MSHLKRLASWLIAATIPASGISRSACRQWLAARDHNARNVNASVATYLSAWSSELLAFHTSLKTLSANSPSESDFLKALHQLCEEHPVVAAALAHFARRDSTGYLFYLLRDAEVSLDIDLTFGGQAKRPEANLLEAEPYNDSEFDAWIAYCQEASLFVEHLTVSKWQAQIALSIQALAANSSVPSTSATPKDLAALCSSKHLSAHLALPAQNDRRWYEVV